jgi:hypothetical protein
MKLAELQRQMAAAIMQPLAKADRQSPRTKVDYIKPNDRLSSLERVEIYSRSYWYRIIDSMFEDFPGVCAALGPRAFARLVRAYLAECPSESYTLRNLGAKLGEWLKRHPGYAGNKLAVALDMIALEWAHIEAWDGKADAVLGPEDLLELGPSLRVGIQPYIRLVELHYPVDELRVRVNDVNDIAEEHEATSNAPSRMKKRRIARAAARLKPERIFVAVHRLDFSIYYRRMASGEFQLLSALRNRRTIGAALTEFYKSSSMPAEDLEPLLESWFAIWAELGWLCRPESQQSKPRSRKVR